MEKMKKMKKMENMVEPLPCGHSLGIRGTRKVQMLLITFQRAISERESMENKMVKFLANITTISL